MTPAKLGASTSTANIESQLTAFAGRVAQHMGLPSPKTVRLGRAPSRTIRPAIYRVELDVIEVFFPPMQDDGTRRSLLLRGAPGLIEALAECLVDRWHRLHGSSGVGGPRRSLEWLSTAARAGLSVSRAGEVQGLGLHLLRLLDANPAAPDLRALVVPRRASRRVRVACACGLIAYLNRRAEVRCGACRKVLT